MRVVFVVPETKLLCEELFVLFELGYLPLGLSVFSLEGIKFGLENLDASHGQVRGTKEGKAKQLLSPLLLRVPST